MNGPVPSPCVNVCRIDPGDGWCEGCARTLDEIARWSALDDEGKREVWAQLHARRAQRERVAAARAAAEGTTP